MIALAWLLVQAAFWLVAMAVTVAGVLAVIAAPPFFAGRYLWLRFR